MFVIIYNMLRLNVFLWVVEFDFQLTDHYGDGFAKAIKFSPKL